MNTTKKVVQVGNKEITLEVGRFSEQADAAVLATCGGTVVHAVVTVGGETNLGYFPLTVEYIENLYAGGRIKGSRWVKRPGRPSDDAILTARVIDRSIRPLFPEGLTREVQVILSVLSVDMENNPDVVAMAGAMAALEISSIPFNGPVAGLRVGYQAGSDQFTFNPTYVEHEGSALDLILAGSQNAIVMVEAGANEVDEEVMVRAFEAGHEQIRQLCTAFSQLRSEVGKEKFAFTAGNLDQAKMAELAERFSAEIRQAIEAKGRLQKTDVIDNVIAQLIEENEENAVLPLKEMFYELSSQAGRDMIIKEKKRPDGRALDEVRPITCEVDILPMTHGSAMFKRGATQALTITTLGSPAMSQLLEDMEGESTRRYIHHYNMPPFASGETGRYGAPKRREIGHGALAERALLPVLPSAEEFPYTIHVVSEIMSSNGSTSQASVCGSSLSLMAAGVPIRKPVSGIAMGLITDGSDHVILTDIQGLEDHIGDMDFKVAGTRDGITAIQMDIKVAGLTMEILREGLQQAKKGRLHIMDEMMKCLEAPRSELAKNAPKIETVKIPVSKIGELIGPGGKNIKRLIEESGAEITVEDDGSVYIASADQEAITMVKREVEAISLEIMPGMEFDGEVSRIEDYGLFVDLAPGKTGLVHVSHVAAGFVENPADHANLGDIVHVRVLDTDGDRIRLTMLTPEEEEQQRSEKREGGDRGGERRGGGDRGGFRGGDRGSRGGFRDGGRGRGGSRGGDRGGRGYRGDR